MKSCCSSTKNDSTCKRKDGKTFSLPRKFSRGECKNPKGFTMRSSCAPYKYCNKGGKRSSNRSKKLTKKNDVGDFVDDFKLNLYSNEIFVSITASQIALSGDYKLLLGVFNSEINVSKYIDVIVEP